MTPNRVTLKLIDAVVQERLGETHSDSHSKPMARQIAMHLAQKYGMSLNFIGREYRRHHTTALASARKIKHLREEDRELDHLLAEMESDIDRAVSNEALAVSQQHRVDVALGKYQKRMHPADLEKLTEQIAERLYARMTRQEEGATG